MAVVTTAPATVSELLAYLDKDPDASEQTELDEFLEAATEAAEGWAPQGRLAVGPIVAREFTDRVRARQGRLYLPQAPVQSVTSATRISDDTEYLTADLDVNEHRGVVMLAQGHLPAGDYTVVYEAGRNPVPVSLKTAVLIIAGHLWQTQQGPTSNRWPGQETSDTFRVSRGYLIPNRAAHLLTPYAPIGAM